MPSLRLPARSPPPRSARGSRDVLAAGGGSGLSGLHPAASKGFARSAAAYERGRPSYPAAAVEFLAARLRLGAGRTVVDLAAGTGKLTRPLLATGAEVIAVEPVTEMRAVLPAGGRGPGGTAQGVSLA